QQAKDLLDRYANLSAKVHINYVDLEKNPLLAREAGIKSLGAAIVQVGAKKEEAKSMTEEGITGAFIRDLNSKTRTIRLVTGCCALVVLDPPLKLRRAEIAENDALVSLLQSWGVTLNKDLILDLNPVGQLVGLGPQVALVSSYDFHPIVNELKGTATGFPLARS